VSGEWAAARYFDLDLDYNNSYYCCTAVYIGTYYVEQIGPTKTIERLKLK
jgi:hypothetical protein